MTTIPLSLPARMPMAIGVGHGRWALKLTRVDATDSFAPTVFRSFGSRPPAAAPAAVAANATDA